MSERDALEGLERLLAAGKDGALLRFGMGNEHLKRGDAETAAVHFRRAVEIDPTYSAAWKMLGRALAQTQRPADALSAWNQGIAAAERRGDKQAMREMQVFVRRLTKEQDRS